jgi:hypothetical protein
MGKTDHSAAHVMEHLALQPVAILIDTRVAVNAQDHGL